MTEAAQRLRAALADRYVIERELGQGGMATVYLAHDVRHDRKVALKVLRPELSAILGAARFLAEIKTTANLQHPHILGLFDSGEADGTVFYVMPYVEGESLRDRITREKQLPVDAAMRIAREVADALQYAHEHGIVHRDIKPENILLHGGHAQVADFGIALAASRSDAGSRMTETGMSLGTPHYMSPEQAMGQREITPKADVYALGCVTYEMLTGEPPFTGPTAQAIIARVMTEQPRSLTLQRHTIPPHVEAAVRTALEKLPADRFDSAAQFAEALANPGYTITGSVPTASAGAAAGAARGRGGAQWWRARWVPAVAAGLVLGMAGLRAGLRLGRPAAPPGRSMRFVLSLPDSAGFVDTFGPAVAVSPDGSMLVYTGGTTARRQLFSRRFDDPHPTAIAGTEGGYLPFFSPDGEWLGFVANQRLMKVRIAGGTPLTIATLLGNIVSGASWGSKDVIVLEDVNGLSRVSAGGGRLEVLCAIDSVSTLMQWPSFLPDGEAALFTLTRAGQDYLALVTVPEGRVAVFDDVPGTDPRYIAPGVVVWATADGALSLAAFDARRRRFTGPTMPMLERVVVDGGAAKIGVGPGVLVQVEGGSQRSRLLRLDRRGEARPEIPDELGFDSPRFSPDGRRIAVGVLTGGTSSDVWVVDRARRTRQRITFAATAARPVWSADGRRLAFGYLGATSWDLYAAPADGSGQPESLLIARATDFPSSWTPSGDTLVFWRQSADTRGDILYLPRSGDEQVFAGTDANESAPTLSPDGRWLAYVSDESGRREVYVRPFPAGPGRWQVSPEGGVEPRWSRHGREIIYRSSDLFLAVPVEVRPTFAVGRVDTLFRGPYEINVSRALYDVTAAGDELVIVGSAGGTRTLTVTLNPLAELLRGGASRQSGRR